MKMRLAAPALLMAGMLAFAACGGDDDDASSVLPATTAKGSASTADDAARASDTTVHQSSSDASDTTADSSSDSTTDVTLGDDTDTSFDFSGAGSDKFCGKIEDLTKDVDLDNIGDTITGPEGKAQFKKALSGISDAADAAPSEIKDDAKKVESYFSVLDAALSKVDYDYTKLLSDPEGQAEFAKALDDPELQTSLERFDAYIQQVCDIHIDG